MADRIPIAIVGAGCRYPDAASPDELWQTVLARRQAFRPIPRDRLNLDDYRGALPGEPADPDTTYARLAAVLEGWRFDRRRFRVPGAAFRAADLTHWLALEVAAQTLESAGFPDAAGLDRDRVGVVLGNTLTGEFSRASLMRLRWPYVRRVLEHSLTAEGIPPDLRDRLLASTERSYKEPFPEPTDETLAGGLSNTIAGRICNHFDLHGGGYTVDGACSSSLLAICTACSALVDGELDFALAGGVDLSLDPFELVGFSRVGALSAGQMRIYDAEPSGFLPGEGCGLVALMRADQAAAAGLTPWALIRGWGVSSDGRGGLTRPEPAGQLLALRRAYRRAGFGPETVALFEGHGTGTAVGDQAEIEALAAAHDGRRREVPAAIGSIKANIGHTKAAAGAAGLLKAALAVRHQVIPPTTGCSHPLELLTAAGSPVQVGDARPWPDLPVRAGVSAMGFGGINTHVVLEAAAPRHRQPLGALTRAAADAPLSHEVFSCAAESVQQLEETLTRITQLAETMSFAEHADLAAAMGSGGAAPGNHVPLPCRIAIVSANPEQLARRARAAVAHLSALAEQADSTLSVPAPGVYAGRGRPGHVGLLFTGQSAAVPSAPGALGRIFPASARYLTGVPDGADASDTAYAQPGIVSASLAGMHCLERLGLRATAAIGHSLGEITALCWAGALAEADARSLATDRGRLMSTLGAPGTGMASVAAPAELTEQLIAGTDLVIAADNGATRVIAGSLADLDRAGRRAKEHGVAVQRLKVSHAFHSPAVAGAQPGLADCLAGISFGRLAGTVYSTVHGRRLTAGDDLRGLLVAQLTAPVRFRSAAELLAADHAVLVEVGPGHGLAALTQAFLNVPAVALDVGTESSQGICEVAAALFAVGAIRTLRALWTHRFHRPFDPWRDFDFLSNPCESAPLAAAAPAVVRGQPDKTAPVQPAYSGAAARAVTAAAGSRHGPRPDARAPAAAAVGGDVAAIVRCLVAEAVELPEEEIKSADRLLGDLHLNSLNVAQLALRAAGACGRAVPAAPLSLADVNVGDLVGVIDALPPENAAAEPAGPVGVADWHRALVAETGPADPSAIEGEPRPRCWLMHGHSTYRPDVAELLPVAAEAPPALLAFLPEDPADADIAALLAAARRACAEAIPLTVVDEGDTASGFLGTICMEHPELAARLVTVPAAGASRPATEVAPAIARAVPVSAAGYSELAVGPSGQLGMISHRPLDLVPAAQSALGPADVVLVTGGARGIGVETAMALGRRFGVPVGLIGRADPDRDDELRANLVRLGEAGLAFRYARADVSDAGQVSAAVADIEAALGPVTALIHASGINRPARFDDLAEEDFTEHSAAKRQGLAVLLASLDPGKLRIVLTYGSVIGRFGLAGEAHYALANGRMRELVRQTAARLPHCWVCNVDFTAWSGSGMGEQLGVIDQLVRSGVSPLPPDRGVELLLQLLAARPAVPSLLVTGRLPQLDRAAAGVVPPPDRYLQRMLALVPGVEAVAETVLDMKRDAYLDDHRIGGLAVLPAVCALEAMAQAAAVLSGTVPAGIADSQFTRPVTVPDDGERVIRVCALRRDDGDIDVVLRSDETGYSADHFRCRVTVRPARPPEVPALHSTLPEHQAAALYGPLFFHGPAFRLLRRFEHLDATSCTAILRPASGIGPDVGRVLLGDVGRNDATIHVLQACVPHRRLLPVGCDRFALHSRPGDGPSASAGAGNGAAELVVAAVERAHVGLDYTYDVVARDAESRPVISWTGLKLRDVGPVETAEAWPKLLLGPYLQRCTSALMPASSLAVNVRPAGARARDRAPSGLSRPQATGTPSRSHLDGAVLEASAATATAACDWEPVVGRDQLSDLRQLVGWADQAEYLRHLTSEPETHVLTRLWTVRQCLSKTGRGTPGPLVVQGAYEDGWVLLRAGTDAVASAVLRLDGETQPVAVAVLVRGKSCQPTLSTSTS